MLRAVPNVFELMPSTGISPFIFALSDPSVGNLDSASAAGCLMFTRCTISNTSSDSRSGPLASFLDAFDVVNFHLRAS